MQDQLEGDVRLQNAEARLADQQRQAQQQGSNERSLLDEIEDKAMVETDPIKLDDLYKEYMDEYTTEVLRKLARSNDGDANMDDSGVASSAQQLGGSKRSSDMLLEELEANVNQIIYELENTNNGFSVDVKQKIRRVRA